MTLELAVLLMKSSIFLLPVPMVIYILGRHFEMLFPDQPNIIMGQVAVALMVLIATPFVIFLPWFAEFIYVVPFLVCGYGFLRFRVSIFHIIFDPYYWTWFLSFLIGTAILISEFDVESAILPQEMLRNGMPIDNEISRMLASAFIEGMPLVFGDWLGVDRPPAFSVFYLLFRLPIEAFSSNYLLLGTLIQSLIFPTIVATVQRLFGPLTRQGWLYVVGMTLLAPLTLHNLAYLWPKIISANYLILFSCFWFADDRRRSESAVAGVCAGIAVLLHGGAFFLLIGAAIVGLTLSAWRLRLLDMAYTLGVFLLCLVPWSLYGSFVQQSHSRLLKWHLAGQIPITELSLGQLLRERYAELGLSGLLGRSVIAFDVQILEPIRNLSWTSGLARFSETFRDVSFFTIPFALGGAGYLILGASVYVAIRGSQLTKEFLFLAFMTTLCWSLLMNSAAAIHEGQYASIYLILIVALGGLASRRGHWVNFFQGVTLALQFASCGLLLYAR